MSTLSCGFINPDAPPPPVVEEFFELVLLDSNYDAIDDDFTLFQGQEFQFKASVINSETRAIVLLDPAVTWVAIDDEFYELEVLTGIITVNNAAPIGTMISIRAEVLYEGKQLTVTGEFEIVEGPLPDPVVGTLTAVAGTGQSAEVNKQLTNPIVLELLDDLLVPIPDSIISLTFEGGGSAPIHDYITDVNGQVSIEWLLGNTVGTQKLLAKSDTGATVEVTATATAATTQRFFNIDSGANQSAEVSTQVPDEIFVKLTDNNGDPVVGAAVSWTPPSGGSIVGEDVVTDASGLAGSGTVTLGATPGIFTVNVTTADGDGASIDITVVAVAAAPSDNITPINLLPSLGVLVADIVPGAPYNKYDNVLNTNEKAIFDGYLANETNINKVITMSHYGATRGRLMWAIRKGQVIGTAAADENTNPYARGRRASRRFVSHYVKVNKYNVPLYWLTGMPDLEAIYVLEGDPDILTTYHVQGMNCSYDNNGYFNGTNNNTSIRGPVIAIQVFSFCHRYGIPFKRNPANTSIGFDSSPGSWLQAGRRQIDWLAVDVKNRPDGSNSTWIKVDGTIPSFAHNNHEVYFFNAWLATELLKWWHFVENEAISLAYDTAKLIMDHLVTEWQTRGGTLPYESIHATGANKDLAAFHVWPALVLWQEEADNTYRDFALAHLGASSNANTAYLDKQFNQIFSTLAQSAEAIVVSGVNWRG